MVILIIILLTSGSVAYSYFKGTIVRSFAMVISGLCAIIAAFTYFEPLANLFISRGTMGPAAHAFCFAALFVVSFVILLVITLLLTRQPVDLGFLPERIGRCVCGILLGFILSGILLTTLVLAPSSSTKPYQRFDLTNPNIEKPSKFLLNADGFTTEWFSLISRGSLSGTKSFAVLHPDFLNQVFLNRHNAGLSLVTRTEAIEVPSQAVWPAPKNLKSASGEAILTKAGYKPVIVRIGIRKTASQDAGDFAVSQLRTVCKEKDSAKNPLVGKGKNIFPIGHLKMPDRIQTKNLADQIKIEPADFGSAVKWIDFVFEIPENHVPVLVEFKQNNVALLPLPVAAEHAPLPEPFVAQSECATDIVQLQPVEGAPVYGIELATDAKFLEGLALQISDVNQWQRAQTDRSIKPAEFENEKTVVVRTELVIKESAEPNKVEAKKDEPKTPPTSAPRKARPKRYAPRYAPRAEQVKTLSAVGNMLKPLEGYKLLSLKCNKPAAGTTIKGEQLPVLVELSGLTHHPVGVIAGGKINDQTVYEVDYCAVPIQDSNDTGCLSIAQNGCVDKPFPDEVWLTGQAQSISEFYTLYMVKTGNNTIITSIKPAGEFPPVGFVKYEGLLLK